MDDSFAFALGDTSRLMRRRFDERARAHGTTSAQWKALLVISRHEGINQGALADRLEVEPITLCRLIDRVEDAGLVERRRDPADRRAWRLFLTDKARPVIDELRAVAADLSAQALQGISPHMLGTLTAALDSIRANLADIVETKDVANG